jgi:hypothetical protein
VGLAWVLGRCRTARTLRWRARSGRRPLRGDDAPGLGARSPAPRSCGPARRPGPRQPAGGCAPAPRRAQALGHDPCRPRHRPVPLVLGAGPHARGVSAAAGPGQLPARPGWGFAIARADREPSLGLGRRRGSARRAGSDGSSRSTGRRPGRPRQRSGSAVAGVVIALLLSGQVVVAHLRSLSWLAVRVCPGPRAGTRQNAPQYRPQVRAFASALPAEAASAQAVVRPSEVDDWCEMTAKAGRSICRSAAV